MGRIENTGELADVTSKFTVRDFTELIKVGIVNSNTITAFTGMWLAFQLNGISFIQNLDIMFFTIVGSALIVAASGAFNNVIDRDIDGKMERTKNRPTMTGKISGKKALILASLLLIIGVGMLFMTTWQAGVLGILGVFLYVVVYSMYAKRKLVSNTVIGSFSGAVPPLIGWFAVDPSFSLIPVMLFLVMFCWQPPHFYAIAIKRKEEYRAAGIPMLPVVKGIERTKISMVFWVVLLSVLPFFMTELGMVYVILATALNIGWLVLSFYGFKMKDSLKWSRLMFVYSLNYMTILFVSMIVISIFL
ncbi:protoheme IX farnesyltransferase [Listeria fleischmannii 1991]|uniref:Protoheme IX farnesyltransferase n=2 Tax=Listeria fleischmannii TaxID=1069827 RepID=A0A2X3GXB0_9LIST|nr:heme o synthase [Listeria fleischmannii]EMG29033.1 protoheme IX farnesyltransferase [Listeria fleischmannii subsp. fleischmannii LU2006-1]KMT59433.1 protoheme IX farnesyltransferase [Listeria fleischmannii 1991]SQC66936.1 Protoheme IX farnesyltransferase 2 [Listeria fleischmannii subsp. fleischmannii]